MTSRASTNPFARKDDVFVFSQIMTSESEGDLEKAKTSSPFVSFAAKVVFSQRTTSEPVKENVSEVATIKRTLTASLSSEFIQPSSPDIIESWKNRRFCFIEKLGRGSFSIVSKVKDIEGERFYALKESSPITESEIRLLENEVDHLKTLDHCSIIKYLNHERVQGHFFTILELGSKQTLCDYSERLNPIGLRYVAAQIVLVVEFLESRQVLHRDLKLTNCLIDSMGRVKLIDFAFAKRLERGEKARTLCGNSEYWGPEVREGEYEFPSQIWATGAVLHKLAFGRAHFRGVSSLRQKRLVHSESFEDLLRSIFKLKPEERLTLTQIKSHPWFIRSSCENPQLFWDSVYSQADDVSNLLIDLNQGYHESLI